MAMAPNVKDMAQRFNATVTVLNVFGLLPNYVVEPPLAGPYDCRPAAIPYTPEIQELRKRREKRLEEFSSTLLSGISRTPRIEDGDAAAVICWVAQHENTDLIMMPTKGLGVFRRLLLGSITAKVLHDVSCPVLTSAHEPDPALASPRTYRSIICAVELNPEAEVVLKEAALLAQAYRARICVLHIEQSFHEKGGEPFDELLRDSFQDILGAGGRGMAVDTTVRVVNAAVPEGIRVTAIEQAADLVVVGRGHLKGGISRMWSQLFTIIRESPCPVLSV